MSTWSWRITELLRNVLRTSCFQDNKSIKKIAILFTTKWKGGKQLYKVCSGVATTEPTNQRRANFTAEISQPSPAFSPFCSSFVAGFSFDLEWFADPVHKAKRLAFHSLEWTNTFHELFYTDLRKSQEPMWHSYVT